MQLDFNDPFVVQDALNQCLDVLSDPGLWFQLIAITLICALIGGLLGWFKGRSRMGFILGLALGPVGWVIVLLQAPEKMPGLEKN